jgi:hypothetical protein
MMNSILSWQYIVRSRLRDLLPFVLIWPLLVPHVLQFRLRKAEMTISIARERSRQQIINRDRSRQVQGYFTSDEDNSAPQQAKQWDSTH